MKIMSTICAVLLLAGVSIAQEDTLQGGSVLIVKDYEPTISDATKLNGSPEIYDSLQLKKEEVKYSPLNKTIESSFTPSKLKAARLKGEPLDKLYNSYARLGVGAYATVKGTVQIHNLRSRKANFGLNCNHLSSSSNQSVKEAGYAGYNDNDLELHGKRFFYNKILSGGVFFERNSLHRYGFNPDTLNDVTANEDLSRENTFQRFQTYGGRVQLKSFYKDSNKLNFDVGGKLRYTEEHYGINELNALMNAKVDRYLPGGYFGRISATVDHNAYVPSVFPGVPNPKTGSTIIRLGASAERTLEGFHLKAEVDGFSESTVSTDFYGRVAAYASYSFARDLLIPYAQLSYGGLERTSFDFLRRQNSFMASRVLLLNREHEFGARGGVRGQFSRNVSFNLQADYDQVLNMPLFVNVYGMNRWQSIENEFEVIYDDVNVMNLRAEVSLEEIGKMNLYFRGDFYNYRMQNEFQAWHLPTYKVSLGGWYDMNDKLVFKGDVFVISERFARSPNSWDGDYSGGIYFEKKLPMLVDVNLSAEYRYSKRLGMYLEIYNLLNSKYNLYNNYRIQGITVMGGLSFSLFSR